MEDSFAVATEEELYAEIARAWCRINPPAIRVRHPMRPFAVGPDLAPAVWDKREDYAQEVIAVCARVISWRQPHGEGAQQVSALTATPEESLDPATAWWQALPKLGDLGLLISEDGLAISDEELAPDLNAIAAPVRCETREITAAASMSAHRSTISLAQLVEDLAPHLIATADSIPARLGTAALRRVLRPPRRLLRTLRTARGRKRDDMPEATSR